MRNLGIRLCLKRFVGNCSTLKRLLGLPDGAKIDSKLLAFFVEVAALETQRLGRVGHVMAMPLQLREQRLALESFHALRQ